MTKQFFDILPPEEGSRKPRPERVILEKKSRKKTSSKRRFRPGISLGKPKQFLESFRRKFISKKTVVLPLLLLLVLAISLFFTLGKAEIEIKPKTELLDFETEILLDSNFEGLLSDWVEKGTVPAEIIEDERTSEKEFPATGEAVVEKKAEGIIRIYNEYSSNSQIFVANTRFVSAEGKLFRSQERVVVPGQRYEGGKLKPGFVDIKIVAAEAGPEYNIEPTILSIPGLLGSEMYTSFYAESFSPMQGGFEGKALQVTEEDLKKGQNLLEKEVQEEILNFLQQKWPHSSLQQLDLIEKEILEKSCGAQVQDNVNSFSCTIRVHTKALVFKESDLESFAKENLFSETEEGKEIKGGTVELVCSVLEKDLKEGRANVNLLALAQIYSPVDEDFLKKAMAGRSEEEVITLLEGQPGIENAKIKFWPFWLKKVPKNTEKIKIKTVLDP